MKLFGYEIKASNKDTVEVAVEYCKSHWVVLIRNPGQKEFKALRDPLKFVRSFDEFGDEVSKRPAIKSFAHKADADTWVTEHLPEKVEVVRPVAEVKKFMQGLEHSRSLLSQPNVA